MRNSRKQKKNKTKQNKKGGTFLFRTTKRPETNVYGNFSNLIKEDVKKILKSHSFYLRKKDVEKIVSHEKDTPPNEEGNLYELNELVMDKLSNFENDMKENFSDELKRVNLNNFLKPMCRFLKIIMRYEYKYQLGIDVDIDFLHLDEPDIIHYSKTVKQILFIISKYYPHLSALIYMSCILSLQLYQIYKINDHIIYISRRMIDKHNSIDKLGKKINELSIYSNYMKQRNEDIYFMYKRLHYMDGLFILNKLNNLKSTNYDNPSLKEWKKKHVFYQMNDNIFYDYAFKYDKENNIVTFNLPTVHRYIIDFSKDEVYNKLIKEIKVLKPSMFKKAFNTTRKMRNNMVGRVGRLLYRSQANNTVRNVGQANNTVRNVGQASSEKYHEAHNEQDEDEKETTNPIRRNLYTIAKNNGNSSEQNNGNSSEQNKPNGNSSQENNGNSSHENKPNGNSSEQNNGNSSEQNNGNSSEQNKPNGNSSQENNGNSSEQNKPNDNSSEEKKPNGNSSQENTTYNGRGLNRHGRFTRRTFPPQYLPPPKTYVTKNGRRGVHI